MWPLEQDGYLTTSEEVTSKLASCNGRVEIGIRLQIIEFTYDSDGRVLCR